MAVDASAPDTAQTSSEYILAQMYNRKEEGVLIFSCVAGSQLYNCAGEGSDNDFLGVYACPRSDALALYPKAAETITKSDPQGDDFTVHEVAKFCRLLLKGNPGIIETLFNDQRVYETQAWRELKRHRKAFLSQQVVHHYIGYIKSQISMYKKSKAVKKLYHVVRLLGETERVIAGGQPLVRMDGPERDRLMTIRAGKVDATALLESVNAQIESILAREPWGLPAQGDAALVYAWLVAVRRGKYSFAQLPADSAADRAADAAPTQ